MLAVYNPVIFVTTFLDLDDSWQSFLLGAMILASVTLYSTSRQMVVAK